MLDRSARAQQHVAIEGIVHREPKLASVANGGFHLLAEMPQTQNGPGDTLPLQQLELVKYEWPTGDLKQRLRNRLGNGSQPSRESPRQDSNREHQDSRIFVPSKSNRKRISSSPACVIACLNLLRSDA